MRCRVCGYQSTGNSHSWKEGLPTFVDQPFHKNFSPAFIRQMFILTKIYQFNLSTISPPSNECIFWNFLNMELFAKTVIRFQLLIVFANSFILDVWQGSEHVSDLDGIQSPFCYYHYHKFPIHYAYQLLFEIMRKWFRI